MAIPRRAGSRLPTTIAIAVIVLLALAAAGRGMQQIPLESHEIYVAQTAENMLHSGDWLVPRLNGEYRLTKPPLSYWLVAGAAAVSGQDQVGPGLARLPSVLAVAGLALLAFWIGGQLFDRRTGLLAGLMCVASLAAFKYGHNARPDMLYAFWTTAMLAAWVGADRAGPGRVVYWSIALWLAFALATLTKGPQAPAILLLGLVLHAGLVGRSSGDGWRALWQRLRPIAGLAIVAVLVLPWYVLLRQRIGAETLGESQLSGALLTVDPLRIFTPFYLLRSPMLWLPWALLLPAAVVLVWRDLRGAAGLLGVSIVFAMLAFALGPQYREIYMLPWLVPAMLLFAAAALQVRWAGFCIVAVLVVVAVAVGWLAWQAGSAASVVVLGVLFLLGLAAWSLRRGQPAAAAALVATAFALGLFQGGAVPALWSKARYQELAFTQALSRRIDPGMPIVVWDIDAAHYSYYLERPVRGFEALAEVCDWIGRQQAETLVIYPDQRRDELARRLTLVPVLAPRESEFQATRVSAAGCRDVRNAGALGDVYPHRGRQRRSGGQYRRILRRARRYRRLCRRWADRAAPGGGQRL